MSVRVCYVKRAQRGALLTGLRLCGSRADAPWQAPAPGAKTPADFDAAARWVRDHLAGTRSPDSLPALCLDADGGVFSWLSSPSRDPAVVATLARDGPGALDDSPSGASASPVEFFAPDDSESLVQPLAPALNGRARGLRLPGRGKAEPAPQAAERLAVLSQLDTPARLLIDALDRAGVGVEGVVSIWHAMIRAWDPAATRSAPAPADARVVADSSAPALAVVLNDAAGRLLWAWGRDGSLLAGGAIRVRGSQGHWQVSRDDASRLVNDWLAWAAQLGEAPSRVVCVVPPGEEGSEGLALFGEALASAWPGAGVDIAAHDDPLGATLSRLAERLEAAPAPRHADASPDHGLVRLTLRRGREHRRLYIWSAAAMVVAAGAVAAWGHAIRDRASDAARSAAEWDAAWRERVGQLYPDVPLVQIGRRPVDILREELQKKERLLRRPDKAEPAMPVLQELETLSFIIGDPAYTLEELSLDTRGLNRVRVVTDDISSAEGLLSALRDIDGSHMADWRERFSPKQDLQGGTPRVLAEFTGSWILPPREGGPQ